MKHWKFYTPGNNHEATEPRNLHHAPKPMQVAPSICTGSDSSRAPSTPITGLSKLLLFPSPPKVEASPRTVQGSTYNETCLLPIDGVSLLNSNTADCARTLSNDVEKLKVTDVTCWRVSIEDSSYRATQQRAA
jgi:hypothetical protein